MQNHSEDLFWYNYNMADEREKRKAIKAIQKICRGSLEYDLWQTRTKSGQTKCKICNEWYGYIGLETHHYPKTMFDICEQVIDDHVFDNTIDNLTGFEICMEIMNKHMLGMVEYVVICKSCHEKFHAGHPEICIKVDQLYQDQKNGKPTIGVQKNTDKQSICPIPVPQMESLKIIQKQDNVVNFINSDGIEIDI